MKVIKQIQDVQFRMLKAIKQICNKHQIPYFLCCGTLLGCIRHHGPIPWDDDLDVGMLRENYERFLAIAPNQLPDDMFVQTWDTDQNYALPHCKIRDLNSHYVETVSSLSGCIDGISIDVLPFDSVPNNKLDIRKHGMKLFDLINIIKIQRAWKFIPENKIDPRKIAKYNEAAKLNDSQCYIDQYNNLCQLYNGRNEFGKISEAAGLDIFRFVDERKNYEVLTTKEYMGEQFSIPKNYEIILQNSYGKYMNLPPENERVGQPGIESVIINGAIIR